MIRDRSEFNTPAEFFKRFFDDVQADARTTFLGICTVEHIEYKPLLVLRDPCSVVLHHQVYRISLTQHLDAHSVLMHIESLIFHGIGHQVAQHDPQAEEIGHKIWARIDLYIKLNFIRALKELQVFPDLIDQLAKSIS